MIIFGTLTLQRANSSLRLANSPSAVVAVISIVYMYKSSCHHLKLPRQWAWLVCNKNGYSFNSSPFLLCYQYKRWNHLYCKTSLK